MKLLWYKLDPASLKLRLTVGIALFSTLGLCGLASWTSMRMQQILVSTHKDNIKYIAERFPHDVKIYSDMVSLEEGVQKAVDNLSNDNIIMWAKSDRNVVTARSQILQNTKIAQVLLPLKNVPPIPQVKDLEGRYWLLCATPLQVKGVNLGKFYIAQDITEDQKMLLRLLRSLTLATIIVTAIMITAIAFYINRSLRPLKRISQLTSDISAERLGEAHFNLENPPSEVKELAETFEKMLLRLSQSWEHQRQLLSNVSHELRTPLTIICGYLESTLRRGPNLTEIQREALTTAASEADRTVQLLQDLLDLARADSGAMHFQLEKIDVHELITEVVAMTKQYSNHQIIFESNKSNLEIAVDKNRCKQVLLNLIDNAIKYSASEYPITIKSYLQDSLVIIEICDRGVGIPLQQQARIFERFHRLDEARNRAGGTGLGLSIVKTLVEGMGGKISVQSQLEKGSTFTLKFPGV
ncbi:Signal transduction histidine kinase [Hyella patelloides LEGE 07179]|uniref:histidine kinase n=1 Tax=Hyella patelloides LEGE 07179 TaxID=945734 RepID=A0A563VU73_9CYAN|nr:HAMP domain-containing sensor histidine kinase [Hyella patelloides]VEP15026.1 Signal transduction histidine kinase [Hyella patelloides LEGE 07179]